VGFNFLVGANDFASKPCMKAMLAYHAKACVSTMAAQRRA
jgi:hypothetical protein